MNITIKPGAAIQDAAQIDEIVSQIQEDMQTLDKAIKSAIPEGIQTNWSEQLREKWESYYTSEIPASMNDIKLSATNLRLAVDQALTYSKQ